MVDATFGPRVHIAITVLSTVIAFLMAAVYYIAHRGLDTTASRDVFVALGISCFVLFAPVLATCDLKTVRVRRTIDWRFIDPLFVLSAVLAPCALSIPLDHIPPAVRLAFALLGYLFASYTLASWVRHTGKTALAFLLFSSCFAAGIVGDVWGNGYNSPLLVEQAILGQVPPDTWAHASIAQMIATYSTSSGGLDGLHHYPYHVGSHWVIGRLSSFTGVPITTGYSLLYPVILVPLFFRSLALCAVGLRETVQGQLVGTEEEQGHFGGWLFWAILFLVNAPLFPPSIDPTWLQDQVVSESFCVGLTLMFTLLLPFLSVGERLLGATSPLGIRLTALALPAVATLALGRTKISTMYMVLVVGWYLVIRLLRRKRAPIVGCSLATIVGGAIFLAERQPVEQRVFPFHQWITYGVAAHGAGAYALFAYYFWVVLYVGIRFLQERLTSTAEVRAAIREYRIVDVEFLVVACFAASLPGMVLAIGYGAAHYFGDIQRWFAAALLLSLATAARASFLGDWLRERAQPRYLLPMTALLVVVVTAATNPMVPALQVVSEVTRIRRASREDGEYVRLPFWKAQALKESVFAQSMKPADRRLRTLRGLLVNSLAQLDELDPASKRTSGVFVPRSNRALWEFTDSGECQVVPYLVPALSGMAMLDGLPDQDCRLPFGPTWGDFGVYDLRDRPAKFSVASDEQVCARARKWGFERVYRIDLSAGGEVLTTSIQC